MPGDRSLRFRFIHFCVHSIPPRQRDFLFFGHHVAAEPLQKCVSALSGYSGLVEFEMKSPANCRFQANAGERYFFMQEEYEPDLRDTAVQRIRPGMTVFDVGGHIGFTALAFASMGGRVVALEPSPVNFARLEHNLSLNPDCQVVAVNAAASDRAGSAHLVDNSSMSSISPEGSLSIRLVRLDEIAAEYGFPQFIKVDVEGHAGPVLRGAAAILSHHPDIMIEIHDEREERAVRETVLPPYTWQSLGEQSNYPKRAIASVPGEQARPATVGIPVPSL